MIIILGIVCIFLASFIGFRFGVASRGGNVIPFRKDPGA